MSENDILDESKRKAIGFGTITFLVGIMVASITMFTFMESRIAKEVQESMRLAQLEQQVKGEAQVNKERFKTLKDTVWASEQNVKTQLMDFSNRISTLESRVSSIPTGGFNRPPAIVPTLSVSESTDK